MGVVSGGVQSNIVPDSAHALFEVRYWETAGENQARSRIRDLVGSTLPEGCTAELVTLHSRPAWSGKNRSSELLVALDTVNHEILMNRLKYRIGICDMTYNWGSLIHQDVISMSL